MLTQIVRPMVRTQIRLLANSQATRTTLVTTIAQWLSFIGVQAHVTELDTTANQIRVSLTVGKPDACDPLDWAQILSNLETKDAAKTKAPISEQQERQIQRLLAYMIQVENPDRPVAWEETHLQLQSLGFDEPMLSGIRAALKVPQSLEQLVASIDPDVAAIALSKAVSIALLDRRVNSHEDEALSALLEAMRNV
jgi:hypothetical protein